MRGRAGVHRRGGPRHDRDHGGAGTRLRDLAGKAATPGTSLYNATKYGLRGFASALRADLRARNPERAHLRMANHLLDVEDFIYAHPTEISDEQ